MSALVHFCCNDESGTFSNWCTALRIEAPDEHFVSLMSDDEDGVPMARTSTGLVFGLCRMSVEAWQYHTGNILWDAAKVSLEDATRLLEHVLSLKSFMVDEATVGGPWAKVLEGRS